MSLGVLGDGQVVHDAGDIQQTVDHALNHGELVASGVRDGCGGLGQRRLVARIIAEGVQVRVCGDQLRVVEPAVYGLLQPAQGLFLVAGQGMETSQVVQDDRIRRIDLVSLGDEFQRLGAVAVRGSVDRLPVEGHCLGVLAGVGHCRLLIGGRQIDGRRSNGPDVIEQATHVEEDHLILGRG